MDRLPLMVFGQQIRAARALLGWEQKQLASAAGVSVETVRRLERTVGPVSAYTGTLDRVTKVLEDAGVDFTNDDAPGVRLRRPERSDRAGA